MMIFHSYVSLPEGTIDFNHPPKTQALGDAVDAVDHVVDAVDAVVLPRLGGTWPRCHHSAIVFIAPDLSPYQTP